MALDRANSLKGPLPRGSRPGDGTIDYREFAKQLNPDRKGGEQSVRLSRDVIDKIRRKLVQVRRRTHPLGGSARSRRCFCGLETLRSREIPCDITSKWAQSIVIVQASERNPLVILQGSERNRTRGACFHVAQMQTEAAEETEGERKETGGGEQKNENNYICVRCVIRAPPLRCRPRSVGERPEPCPAPARRVPVPGAARRKSFFWIHRQTAQRVFRSARKVPDSGGVSLALATAKKILTVGIQFLTVGKHRKFLRAAICRWDAKKGTLPQCGLN